MSLLVIIFIIKFLARNVFNIIRVKYGLESLRTARKWEKLNLPHEKINCDLKFLLRCKRDNIIPKFAQPKLSIYASYKIKRKIAKTIIEAEITNKHREKKKVRTELKDLSSKLKEEIGNISYQSLKYRIRNVVQIKKIGTQSTQKETIDNIKSRTF